MIFKLFPFFLVLQKPPRCSRLSLPCCRDPWGVPGSVAVGTRPNHRRCPCLLYPVRQSLWRSHPISGVPREKDMFAQTRLSFPKELLRLKDFWVL